MFSDFWYGLGVWGFTYLILAMQLRFGFPPAYRSAPSIPLIPATWSRDDDEVERVIKLIFPTFFAMFAAMILFIATEWLGFMAFFGGLAAWTGLRIRQDLLKTIDGPVSWLQNKWTLKWPMLVFDARTLTLSLAFFAFVVR